MKMKRVNPHILSMRTILFGEIALDAKDRPTVANHISDCDECKEEANDSIWQEFRVALHPTLDQIGAYALPEYTDPSDFLGSEDREYLERHLRICHQCQGLYRQELRAKDVLQEIEQELTASASGR